MYRTELAARLQDLGYEVERGKAGAPEIKGYSQEYLDASSPRSAQIRQHSERSRARGGPVRRRSPLTVRGIPKNCSHRPRCCIGIVTSLPGTGTQADWVVNRALANTQRVEVDSPKIAQQSVTYARDHVFERNAVQDERAIVRAAMDRSMGQATAGQVRGRIRPSRRPKGSSGR